MEASGIGYRLDEAGVGIEMQSSRTSLPYSTASRPRVGIKEIGKTVFQGFVIPKEIGSVPVFRAIGFTLITLKVFIGGFDQIVGLHNQVYTGERSMGGGESWGSMAARQRS